MGEKGGLVGGPKGRERKGWQEKKMGEKGRGDRRKQRQTEGGTEERRDLWT